MDIKIIKNKLYFIFFAGCLMFISCKSSHSFPLITGGIPSSDDPAVLLLYTKTTTKTKLCTSFVVSHNTLLTAAHCLFDKVDVYVKKDSREIHALSFNYSKNYDISKHPKLMGRLDIGIVIFEDHSFDDIQPLKLNLNPVSVGDKVKVVGFGCRTKRDESSGRIICDETTTLSNPPPKRSGTTSLSVTRECGPYMIQTPYVPLRSDDEIRDPTGVDISVYDGDSGSPLLLENDPKSVVGVVSYVREQNEEIMFCATSIWYEENIDFFKKHNIETYSITTKQDSSNP